MESLDHVEVLPEPLEPHTQHHSHESSGWRTRFAEHLMWVLSRSLLIMFILLVAYLGRIPFHRLVQRDVVLDMEQAEREKALDKFKLVSELSVASAKFEASFNESGNAVIDYEHDPTAARRLVAEERLRAATRALDRLRDRFANRQELLEDTAENDFIQLISDGEHGVDFQAEILRNSSLDSTRPHVATFEAHEALIGQAVRHVCQYEKNYIEARRRDP